MRGVLAGVARMPSAAREHALAVVVEQHDAELDRDARRLVRTLGVAEPDRAAALEVVGTVQRAVLRDAVAGRRAVDGRSWTPTVRFEAVRAVGHEAAQGRLAVTPYQHRLAADRAALLALRQAAAATDRAIAQAVPQAGAPRRAALPGMVFPPVPKVVAPPTLVPRTQAVRRGVGHPAAATGPARSSHATRSVRFGAAAALSSVTLIFGAAIAPADDNVPEGATGDFELDSLQLQPFGLKPFDLDGVEPTTGPEGEEVEEVPQVVPAPEPSPTPSATAEQPARPAPEPAPRLADAAAPQPAPEPAPAPAPVAPSPGATPPAPDRAATRLTPGRDGWDSARDEWQRLQDEWDRAREEWERARDDWRRARETGTAAGKAPGGVPGSPARQRRRRPPQEARRSPSRARTSVPSAGADAAARLSSATWSTISARWMRTSRGASMPTRTPSLLTDTTVTTTSSPMRIRSPTFRPSTSIRVLLTSRGSS
ncbi:hypothetical protein BJF88_09945 [Cellulosimicrobium sp. CUA-896]|nr:hypothetical protein BJF88_09945 [Cellulosimicrobium sp. CUA-896]